MRIRLRTSVGHRRLGKTPARDLSGYAGYIRDIWEAAGVCALLTHASPASRHFLRRSIGWSTPLPGDVADSKATIMRKRPIRMLPNSRSFIGRVVHDIRRARLT